VIEVATTHGGAASKLAEAVLVRGYAVEQELAIV
jgi:hypothetical protein